METSSSRPVVVVITGASAGVGRAAARRFAEIGADVGLLARGEDGLAGAAAEVKAYGSRALAIPVDVADAERVETAARQIEDELGPIDIWVNNAMASVFSPVREMSAAEFRRVTEVSYLGYVHGTLAALSTMLRRDNGVIIQVGSALAYRSIPLQSAYCAAKAAIRGFTDSLRTELLRDGSGVRVSMVHMPALNTPQFDWVKSRLPHRAQPVPPIFQPEVAAEAIVYAARNDVGRELLVGLPTLAAIYGNRVAPRWLDRILSRHGYDAQQTDEPALPGAPNNLWEPLPGDHGAHGRFDSRSRSFSSELWLRKHRGLVTAGVTTAALALMRRRSRSRRANAGRPSNGGL